MKYHVSIIVTDIEPSRDMPGGMEPHYPNLTANISKVVEAESLLEALAAATTDVL